MDNSVIVVMLCAGSKQPDAGHLRRGDGRKVMFVARPHPAPADDGRVYARPDDAADSGISWRKELLRYNQHHQATGRQPAGATAGLELVPESDLPAAVGKVRAG